jgi:ABC-type glucose/galactose transport system permease subunit|tara:strand:- start:63 stop:269 length:207 start_codon:yes stop_codon:yes gene_type:complete
MIFEEEKIAGVDVDLIENNGFNVVVSPKVLRSNRNRAVPTIGKNPIEVERVLVIILGVVCLLIPFLVT